MLARRVSRLWEERVGNRAGVMLMVAVLCGLAMGGCGDLGETLADLFRINGNNGSAEAQDDTGGKRLIETFQISAGSFRLEADTAPTVTVMDGATRYEITADSTASFIPTGQAQRQTFELVMGDEVIERPGSNTVTLNQDNN